jgi:hypothetical protein
MKSSIKDHLSFISKNARRAIREGDGISDIQKKEKLISFIIYLLIIVITVSLMLFLLNI